MQSFKSKVVFHFRGAPNVMQKAREALLAFLEKNADLIATESRSLKSRADWTPPSQDGTLTREPTKESEMTVSTTPKPEFTADHTWLQIKDMENQQAEDEHYIETKRALRKELKEIKRQVRNVSEFSI